MARLALYLTILVLALFVLTSAFVLRHGGGASEAIRRVSVHDLATATEQYVGERVTTVGVLRQLQEPEEHFVVEAGEMRVAIIGYDREALLELEGQTVTVTGRFDFKEGTGRLIQADSVTPAR